MTDAVADNVPDGGKTANWQRESGAEPLSKRLTIRLVLVIVLLPTLLGIAAWGYLIHKTHKTNGKDGSLHARSGIDREFVFAT